MKLFCYIYRDCDLLPHFFMHYDQLGVTEYCFIVNQRGNARLMEQVRRFAEGQTLRLRVIDEVFLSREKDRELEQFKNVVCQPDEWIFVVDLDEFAEFAAPVPELLAFCDEQGFNVVYGEFADRISQDGRLRKVLPNPSIYVQFPLTCDITAKVLGGMTKKTVLRKAALKIMICCHVGDGIVHDNVVRAQINHYKWNESVINRLRERAAEFKARNMCWWKESQNFLDYYETHGRINVQDPRLQVRGARPAMKAELEAQPRP